MMGRTGKVFAAAMAGLGDPFQILVVVMGGPLQILVVAMAGLRDQVLGGVEQRLHVGLDVIHVRLELILERRLRLVRPALGSRH
jgi:hypothetical protein